MRCIVQGTAAWLLIVVVSGGAWAQDSEQDLPAPQEGYSWKWLEDVKGAVMLPDGWFFRKDTPSGVIQYSFSKEDIDLGKGFETGFTVPPGSSVPTFRSWKTRPPSPVHCRGPLSPVIFAIRGSPLGTSRYMLVARATMMTAAAARGHR